MDEARAVLDRLERIELLDRGGATRDVLLGELRELVLEAEAWARTEGGEAGKRATEGLRVALDACGAQCTRDMIAV